MTIPRRAAVALLALAAAILAGCGGGSTTVIIHKGGSHGGSTVVSTSTETSTVSTTTTTSTTAPAETVHLATFRSPTGNIGCALVGGQARCDINHRDWSPPPRPPSCPNEVDFGQGLEVGNAGAGRFVCAGDTALNPSAAALPYGTTTEVGRFACVSRSTGMTCTNRGDGHGFELSIQGYRAF